METLSGRFARTDRQKRLLEMNNIAAVNIMSDRFLIVNIDLFRQLKCTHLFISPVGYGEGFNG